MHSTTRSQRFTYVRRRVKKSDLFITRSAEKPDEVHKRIQFLWWAWLPLGDAILDGNVEAILEHRELKRVATRPPAIREASGRNICPFTVELTLR